MQLTCIRGCVTPLQIANLQSQLEGLDTDDDEDMELIDGWETLTPEMRDLIREAVKVGHVGDDVWKGVCDPADITPLMLTVDHRTLSSTDQA